MSAGADPAVIVVEKLSLDLASGEAVVADVSLRVGAGEILGLVGESGSGKTTTALALLGYTRPGVRVRDGTITVGGVGILGRDARSLRSLRGRVISYVPQDPGGALNPSMRVGGAIMASFARIGPTRLRIRQHALRGSGSGSTPSSDTAIPTSSRAASSSASRLPMACVCQPPVSVLDEPTTGLDVITQDRMLKRDRGLATRSAWRSSTCPTISPSSAEMADRIAVMYAGRIVEEGTQGEVLERPRHPYTQALVSRFPIPRPRSAPRDSGSGCRGGRVAARLRVRASLSSP